MKSKHITFISTSDQWFKNDELLKSERFIKKWNKNVYSHITLSDEIPYSNLIIYFGSALKGVYPDKYRDKLFNLWREGDNTYYSMYDYSDLDVYSKREQNTKFKDVKKQLENYFEKYAVIRVTHRDVYHRDLNFRKQKRRNSHKKDHFFVPDERGKYKSYDGKPLKKVPKTHQTIGDTYEKHLSPRELFYFDQFPKIGHSKLISYFTYDIETNMSLDSEHTPEPIISIAGYSNIYDTMFTWLLKKYDDQKFDKEEFKDSKVFVFTDEREMLVHFIKMLKKISVDLIGGWNSDYFDTPYIINRMRKLKIREVEETFFNIYKKTHKNGNVVYMCEDTIFWDYMQYYKWITTKNKPAGGWSLDSVANHLFKERKIVHEGIEWMWENDLNKLVRYNIQDTFLTEKIVKRVKLVENPIQLQMICPQDFENVYYNSKTIENMLHQRFKQFKFPTKVRRTTEEKFVGALVVENKTGHFNNVASLDYEALYPCIIMSFNLSPECIVSDKPFDPKTMAKMDDVIFDQTNKGIITQLTEFLVNERNKIKRAKKKFDGNSLEFKLLNDKEMNFKALVNSVYGILGFQNFMLYKKEVAKSVTYIDRKILEWTINQVEAQDYQNLAGDTDSVFVEIKAKDNDVDIAIENSMKLEKHLNNNLDDFVRGYTECEDTIKNHKFRIEFEKLFSKLFLTQAKKKQVGYLTFYKGKKLAKRELSITGFESVKGDTPNFFKRALIGLYKVYLDHHDNIDKIREYANVVKRDLKSQPVENLIERKKMSKKMKDYDGLPMHIRALQNSMATLNRGEEVNVVYVTDDREVIHYSKDLDLKFKIDYKKYFNKFFVDKLAYLDKDIHYTLFLSKTMLINKSRVAIKKMKKKKLKTIPLGVVK